MKVSAKFYLISVAVVAAAGLALVFWPSPSSPPSSAQADVVAVDINRCDHFESEDDRNECKFRLVYEKIFKTGDISHCDEMSEEDRSTCRLRGVIHAVIRGLPLELCDQLEEDMVEDCKYNAGMQLVYYGEDRSLCEKLGEASNRQLCYQRADEVHIKLARYNSLTQRIQGFLSHAVASDTDGVQASEVETGALQQSVVYDNEGIKIAELDHFARSDAAASGFTQVEAVDAGIDVNTYTALEFKIPFDQGRGIASGDFDNDGWIDLVFATRQGIRLYKNDSRGGFEKIAFSDPFINDLDVFVVSFVDINNDGWLDVYLTTYGEGQFFVLNDRQGFQSFDVIEVEASERFLTQAASFADIDRDADLDFYSGYLSHSRHENRHWKHSSNHLMLNENLRFSPVDLDQAPGETLTVLFSDINLDGFSDLLVGNDFEGPDSLYFGVEGASFRPITKHDNVIPVTAYYNMSYDSGDLNNDLRVDLFSVDLGDLNSYSQHQVNRDYCIAIKHAAERQKCETVLHVYDIVDFTRTEECLEVQDAVARDHCMLAILVKYAEETRNPELCKRIPELYKSQRLYCENVSIKATEDYQLPFPDLVHQEMKNALLLGTPDDKFEEATEHYGVEDSHWSWNAKFADLDNDGWQDIYVGNGYDFDLHKYTSNIFFRNEEGKKFIKAQEQFGLTNYFHTPSYTLFDADNDGDLDMASHSINAPAVLYFNHEQKHHTVTFEVRDQRGNHFGIGTKVFVYYDGGHQMREIKAGGGYLSFDAPLLHFGLGAADTIEKIEIHWSTGEQTLIDQPLAVDKKYILLRES